MKLRSTFARLFFDNLVVMAVTLVVVGLLTYHRLDENYQAQSHRDQDRLLQIFCSVLQDQWPLENTKVQQTCRLWGNTSTRFTVIAADGVVLGDSQADPMGMANHKTPDRPEIISALAGV